jgi:hypothetical protein
MKKITSLLIFAVILCFSSIKAADPETCTSDAMKFYYTTNAGWSNSEWYKIIDIDTENLNTTALVAHNGADGRNTSSNFSSGSFSTPVYKWNDVTKLFEVTTKNWPINFYYACQAPTFYTSARTKVDNGATVSGNGVADAPCYHNNNSVKTSPVWDKKGFIELSRQGNGVAPSLHGYIQINDLPQVERIQYSFSSTAWKRGFKLDIKHGDGAWEPLRWEANNVTSIVSFAEQGYSFEEIIGKQDDASSKISLRWRIWDGDSVHVNPVSSTGATFTTVNTPFANLQVVRIHQIRIYSGVDAPDAPTGVKNVIADAIKINLSNKELVLSEFAKVEIFSYDGKRLFNATSDRIDVSNFSKGLYIVKATGASGKSQKKIVL